MNDLNIFAQLPVPCGTNKLYETQWAIRPERSTVEWLAFPSRRYRLGSLRSVSLLTAHSASLPEDRSEQRNGGRHPTETTVGMWGEKASGKGPEPPVPSKRKWREAARRSLHGPFRSLITSGREPGQERDTPLVHPLLTSLPRSWRISLFVSLSRDRIPHSFVPSVAYRRYVGSLLRAPLVSFGSSFVSCSALRARRMVRINNNCMDLYIGLIKPVRKGTKDKFISQ